MGMLRWPTERARRQARRRSGKRSRSSGTSSRRRSVRESSYRLAAHLSLSYLPRLHRRLGETSKRGLSTRMRTCPSRRQRRSRIGVAESALQASANLLCVGRRECCAMSLKSLLISTRCIPIDCGSTFPAMKKSANVERVSEPAQSQLPHGTDRICRRSLRADGAE